jgi:hypothetical protein
MARKDDWTFYIKELATHTLDGRDAIYTQIKELMKAGYCARIRIKQKNPKGSGSLFGGIEYILFETKATQEMKDEYLREFQKKHPHAEYLPLERKQEELKKCFPHPAFPDLGKPALTSTEEQASNETQCYDVARARVVEKPSFDYATTEEEAPDPKESPPWKPMQDEVGPIEYITPAGKKKQVTETEIYQKFLKEPYNTETVKTAIKRLRKNTSPISDPIKYLLGICANVEKAKKNTSMKKKRVEKTEADYTEISKKPEVNISWQELLKKNNEKPLWKPL